MPGHRLKVLDLFCGLKGFSKAFEDRGHKVITVDIDKKFNPSIIADVSTLDPSRFKDFDVILAAPPCNCFSVASIWRYWNKDKTPKEETKKAIQLVKDTLRFIKEINPRFWILENPRGMLRTVIGKPAITTFFCCWEHELNWYKPTDLWGELPKVDWIKPENWIKSSRGDKNSGLQSTRSPEERAKIPYKLSLILAKGCEGITPKKYQKRIYEC